MEVQWHKGRRPLAPRNTSILADSIRAAEPMQAVREAPRSNTWSPTKRRAVRYTSSRKHWEDTTSETKTDSQVWPVLPVKFDLLLPRTFLDPLSFFLSVSMYVLYYFHILFLFCNFKMMKWRKATWHTCIDRNRI